MKRNRTNGLPDGGRVYTRTIAVLAFATALLGCTPAYVALGGVTDGLKAAVGGYELSNQVRRRQITAEADCSGAPAADVPACFAAALAPFEASREPVKACIAAAAPLVRAAEVATAAKDARAAAVMLPQLIAKAAECKAAIEEVSR